MSEFDLVALGDIADIRMGQSPDSSSYTDDDRFIPFLQGCSDFTEEFPETRIFCSNPGKVAPEGSLLVSVRAPVGTTNIADQEYCIGRGLASVNSGVLPAIYLREVFNLSANFLHKRAQGSTFDAISSQDLRAFPIPVPKKKKRLEQLVAILKSVNSEIMATQALIDKHAVIKQGMMVDLFSCGIDPVTGQLRLGVQEAPELYRDTPLGSLPIEWEVLPASVICERVIDCKNRTPPERDEGFAVVKTFNIKDGELVFDTLTFTDRLSFDIWTARGAPSPGDIVITREAPVGESFLIEEGMPQLCLGQRTMLYRPDPSVIDSDFMYFATRSPRFQKRLLDMAGGSTVGHVRVGDVKEMLFPIPSAVEQKAIAKNCTAINNKLRAEKIILDKLNIQKTGLMHDLLTGKVPVVA